MADGEALAQFAAVTGADKQTASFFLESAGGDLDAAVTAYFENPEGPRAMAGRPSGNTPQSVAPPASRPVHQAQAGSSQALRPPPAAAGIRGLADLTGDDTDGEDSDEGNEYYAGGEKSGQVVRGAPKGDPKDVEAMFNRARQAGAREGTQEDLPQQSTTGSFQGASHSLGGSVRARPPEAPPAQAHVITFWANDVFTVDDGEPRTLEDPANKPFLDAVFKGECPVELDKGGKSVQVSLLRKAEPYTPPEQPRYVAFAGTGQTLTGATAAPSGYVPGPETSVTTVWEGIDDSQQATSLQLRMMDGSRMVARFNLCHTVGDIRRFIRAAKPQAHQHYRLATAYPAAALDDDSVTIEAANLQNAVVVQKPC